ncbi:hypothetical protein AVP1_0159 [Aeromonas phage AVP1]|nr:hypothetical protein AVP1_0159 [Aeromonas phage AVP1]
MLSSSGLIILTSSLIKAVTSNILFQSKETHETIKLDQRVPVSIYGKCYYGIVKRDLIMENHFKHVIKEPIDYYLYFGFDSGKGSDIVDLFTAEITVGVITKLKSGSRELEFTPGKLQDSDFYAFVKSIGENLVY